LLDDFLQKNSIKITTKVILDSLTLAKLCDMVSSTRDEAAVGQQHNYYYNGFVRGAAPFSHGRRTFSGRFYSRARQQTSGRGVVGGDAPQDR
jgi:hypothetical protein